MVHVRMCKSLGFCLTTSSTAGVANSDETEPTTYFVGSIVTSNFLLHAVHMTARERDGMRRNNRKFMSCPWVIDMPALCSLTPAVSRAGARSAEGTRKRSLWASA